MSLDFTELINVDADVDTLTRLTIQSQFENNFQRMRRWHGGVVVCALDFQSEGLCLVACSRLSDSKVGANRKGTWK